MVKDGTASVAFTNNYALKVGRLIIRKIWAGDEISEEAKASLRFVLKGKDIGGAGVNERTLTYADFTNGEYTAENLPLGETYTVQELNARELAAGFVLVAADSVTEQTAVLEQAETEVTLTNTYKEAKKTTFEKKIDDINDSTHDEDALEWNDSADYDIGDAVPYRLRATLAGDVSSFRKYHITLVDTLEESLTNNRDYRVLVGGVELAKDMYTVQDSDHDFELRIDWENGGDYLPESMNGEEVLLYFTATLNEKANLGDMGNVNTAYMRYSHDAAHFQNGEDEETTEEDRVIVFTYRVTVNKLDQDGKNLAGAEFRLEKKLADGTLREIALDEEKSDSTTFSYKGLDDGVYLLTETRAPAGCTAAEPITFTVTADHEILWEDDLSTRRDVLISLTGDKVQGDITFEADAAKAALTGDVINTVTASLKVTKTVEGAPGSRKQFRFTLTLKDAAGKELTGAFPATLTVDGKTTQTTVRSGGSFQLAHGDILTVNGLPVGTQYAAREDAALGFTQRLATDANGVITAGGAAAAFVNTADTTSFSVRKEWRGGDGGAIKLTLYTVWNGRFTEVSPQPEATRNGDVYTYNDLPAYDETGRELVYAVKETYMNGYMTRYRNVDAYAKETKAAYNGATIINSTVTEFRVRKVWEGLDAGAIPGEIKLTLYQDGKAIAKQPRKSSDGWYTFYNLEVGHDYYVIEEPVPGFTARYENSGINASVNDRALNNGTIINFTGPATGDTTPLGLWASLAAASALAGAALLLTRKKRNG